MLLEAMAARLNTSKAAARALKAIVAAGCHVECMAAMRQLQLLCATESAADEVAGMSWFQSLQHLLQAAPITLGKDLSWGMDAAFCRHWMLKGPSRITSTKQDQCSMLHPQAMYCRHWAASSEQQFCQQAGQ